MCAMSFPAISGAAIIAHSEKCDAIFGWRHAAIADLEHVGIVPVAGPGIRPQRLIQVDDLEHGMRPVMRLVASRRSCPQMSPVVRHRLPVFFAQSHGLAVPHSQIEKTMSRPLERSASAISA